MTTEREKKSFLNIIINSISMIVQTILVFIVRMAFTKYLNEEYLGIQGLFTNIISMLSLAELGIGTAISFSLYKPLAHNDVDKVNKIISKLRKIYILIGVIILSIGIVITPFLHYIVTDYSMGNLELIFIIYLLTLAIGYFLGYPEILISADQKRYKISYIHLLMIVLVNVFQLFVLILYKSFIIYIIVSLLITLIKYIITSRYVKKEYSNYNFKYNKKLDDKETKEITCKVKSLFCFKIGDYLVNSTDNILISKIVNISTVGFYSNYLSIVIVFKNLINTILSSITPTFGNLIVREDEQTSENVFDVMEFFNFFFNGLVFVLLLVFFNDFIMMCFGKKYVLEFIYVLLICINFYLVVNLVPLDTVKSAAGLYEKDKYVPLIQAAVNLIVSIIFGIKFGLTGILIGTMASYLLVVTWERPWLIYKYIFKKSSLKYFYKFFLEILFITMVYFVSNQIVLMLNLKLGLINLIISVLLITIIYILLFILCNFKRKEFKYMFKKLRNVGRK